MLEDVACCAPSAKAMSYTHFQGGSHARLDRVYISSELVSLCCNYSVDYVSFSDHCLVSFWLGESKKTSSFTWDLWKLNAKLLRDESFVSTLKATWQAVERRGHGAGERWEMFKQEVKMCAIEKSCAMKHKERRQEGEMRLVLKKAFTRRVSHSGQLNGRHQ